jgi:hypothetical protein
MSRTEHDAVHTKYILRFTIPDDALHFAKSGGAV